MNLPKEKLGVIIISGGVIIFICLYLFLYQPLINKLSVSSRECAVWEKQVRQTRDDVSFLKNIEDKKKLVTEEDLPVIIDELTRKGKTNRIDFISIVPGKTEEIKNGNYTYQRSILEMEAVSSYMSLGIFLGGLEKLEKGVVTLDSFNIVKNKNGPDKLSAKLVLNIYLLAEK